MKSMKRITRKRILKILEVNDHPLDTLDIADIICNPFQRAHLPSAEQLCKTKIILYRLKALGKVVAIDTTNRFWPVKWWLSNKPRWVEPTQNVVVLDEHFRSRA